MCCEEASSKLASDFKNYLNSSIYKLEGQRNSYETIIGGILSVIDQVLCTIKAYCYCIGRSKCRALLLYAIKLTKARAIFILIP